MEKPSNPGQESSGPPEGGESYRSQELRVIGRPGALAIVAGSMLGIGIFLVPRLVAEQLPSPGLFLLAWVLGALIAFSGAVAYAELGSLFPRAGGDYVFLRETFGSSVSFAAGWLLFAGVFVGSVATISVPIFEFQVPVLLAPFTEFDPGLQLAGQPIARWGALVVVILLTLINVRGTKTAAGMQVVLTVVPLALLSGLALYALLGTSESVHATTEASTHERPLLAAMVNATLAIYFAYSGWNAVGYVGGEVRDPGRVIPFGLLGGTLLISSLYLLLCAAFLSVLGVGGLQQTFEAGTALASALGGVRWGWAMNLLIVIALLGSLNSTILAGARIACAMARDGVLPRRLARLHPRWRTPASALALQATLAIVLILTGTFDVLIELTGIAMFVMGGLTVAALLVLRHRYPQWPRPYRATGYPALPMFYLLASVVVIGASLHRILLQPESEGVERWLPVMGLGIFAGAWLFHKVRMQGRQARAT